MRKDYDKAGRMAYPRSGVAIAARRARSRRRAVFARGMRALARGSRLGASGTGKIAPATKTTPRRLIGYDPELLYVECGRCGAPVLWDEGKATELLRQAGVDPLELDPYCLLVTDACPACGSRDEYAVRIFRVATGNSQDLPPTHGNA